MSEQIDKNPETEPVLLNSENPEMSSLCSFSNAHLNVHRNIRDWSKLF